MMVAFGFGRRLIVIKYTSQYQHAAASQLNISKLHSFRVAACYRRAVANTCWIYNLTDKVQQRSHLRPTFTFSPLHSPNPLTQTTSHTNNSAHERLQIRTSSHHHVIPSQRQNSQPLGSLSFRPSQRPRRLQPRSVERRLLLPTIHLRPLRNRHIHCSSQPELLWHQARDWTSVLTRRK